MPYSKQHFNEKSRMAKKNSRKGRPCPCTICRFQSIHSENVVKRHLETFGRYESELESGSDDEGNIDHQLQEDIGENLHDTSSSETDEGKRKRRRTQQSFRNSVIAERNDPGCEVMQVSDTSTVTDSTRYHRNLVMSTNETTDHLYSSESENSSPTMYEENSDLPLSRRSDNHDQFINESSSSLINSSSESEDETHEQDSNVYTSQRAKIPLFENSEFTVLQTLAGYFQWFTEHPSISKSALSGILRLKKRLLPQPNNLPGTYEEACNFVKPFLLPFETYHVCPNDCVLFRKTTRYDYSKLVSCPVCGTKRYSANKKARRTFMYYPLGPRWRRMYGSATISELLQNHHYGHEKQNVMHDIHDSPSWKKAFSKGEFHSVYILTNLYAWFNSTCYHAPSPPPGICIFFLILEVNSPSPGTKKKTISPPPGHH